MQRKNLYAAALLLGSMAIGTTAALMPGDAGSQASQEALAPALPLDATADDTEADLTATYIANPSFEDDDLSALSAVNNSADGLRGYTVAAPQGWTVAGTAVTSLLVTKDCYADNNFGLITTIPDGAAAYYLRMGWSTGQTTLSQTVKSLPKGKYKLTASVRTGYANSASSSFSLFAGAASQSGAFSQGSASCFTSMAWQTVELAFEQAAEGDLSVGLAIDWLSGGSCISIDNIRLQRVPDDYVEPSDPTEEAVASPTEGVINDDFVDEATMKGDLMAMLAKFATYMKADFQDCAAPNSVNEACGCFKGENTMGNNEQGVRPNADLSMICAFLAKYGKGKVELPAGVTWDDVETMAMKSLVFAYSTHKANKLKVCSGGNYWGSTSTSDYVWESSLWAMSVAYSAFFQWDKLSDTQKGYVEKLLKAECNYELGRSIPTGYNGDTKAEENGWEADVLAATLGLFPNDELAPRWFARLREFAINSYSHKDDANDQTVIDPDYDQATVASLYKGQNLFDDYTLQNHSFFHTSYQNVVMQELGEAALALKLFQAGTIGEEKWKTNALRHNNDKVMKNVLGWLALADGELAMPNGNDWSLFLYDQITSYSTQACFEADPDALLLENLAYKYIKARQITTDDGSWLLRPDVGARRMGVEAHRVMMTWLMHEASSTASVAPTTWEEFNYRHAEAMVFPAQNVVRAANGDRFTCFSWSSGKQSYTGYIAANTADKNKIIVPFRANNTGNFIGYYAVSGKATNATPVVSGVYGLRGNSYTMNGELNTNDNTLNNRFAIYSTPGNPVVYLDHVRANAAATITKEQGGLMAISTDELTRLRRTLYYGDTHKQLDGATFATLATDWVNIDNALGVVNVGGTQMGFGDRAANNSIMTAKLYASYSDKQRTVAAGDVVGRRAIVYYSNTNAADTKALAAAAVSLNDKAAEGWGGVMVPGTGADSAQYMLLANFVGDASCTLKGITTAKGAPVFPVETTIDDNASTATFRLDPNHSVGATLLFFVEGSGVKAVQDGSDSAKVYIQNTAEKANAVKVTAASQTKAVSLKAGDCVTVSMKGGELTVEGSASFPEEADPFEGYTDITAQKLANPSFEEDQTYGDATGNVTLGGVAYNPCYVNTVKASDGNFPNVLPVKGWASAKALNGKSNYCRMYSMPYSATTYCVSPSNVGNYAALCAAPAMDEACGVRGLTVLNSWAKGDNAITQTVTLPKGEYRVLLDMKYECANQTANDGLSVKTANNTNTSLTGVKIGTATDYRYPSTSGTWERMAYDFTLTEQTDVTLSLGFNTSSAVGAANNTLLYIDNVRIGQKNAPTGVQAVHPSAKDNGTAYNLAGQRVPKANKGVFIKGGKKRVAK